MKQEEVFILRRWRNYPKELWRASLKNIETKEVRYFHSPESLAKYFAQVTESAATKAEEKNQDELVLSN